MNATKHIHDDVFDALPLYVFGLLTQEEARAVDAHLASGCAECREELSALEGTAGELPHSLEAVKPHARVKEKLMSAIAEPPRRSPYEEVTPGIFVQTAERQRWRKTPFKGVEFKILYVDPITRMATSLLKLEPGSTFPAHHHHGVEQSLVMEGSCRVGPYAIKKGDFAFAVDDTEHGDLVTDEGCLLLIIAPQHDEVRA